ncbi:iron ABC transporter permease, partial [Fusobacterium mortiferum]|nr:iron ABC transporter permease [Fusobacterium mortiferum]
IGAIPIGYSFMYQYIKKFPITILEAAELDCKNFYQRFRYVDFPILKNIFISSFLQIFAVIFGEFTVVYTMQLGDILPIASLVNYSLVSNKKYMESSAFSAIILFIVLGAFLLGEYFKERD